MAKGKNRKSKATVAPATIVLPNNIVDAPSASHSRIGGLDMTINPSKTPIVMAMLATNDTNVDHSVDFRSLKWFNKPYTFTANQAPVVRMLYEHWKKGTPDVGDESLLAAVDPESPPNRLNTLFRKHPAWNNLIVPGHTKGTHRLAESWK